MNIAQTTSGVVQAAKGVFLRPLTPNDINDEQFMKNLERLKQLRSFLVEQAIQLQPTAGAASSFGKLNLLHFRDDGRSPTEDEWDSLETLTETLFRQLTDPLRRRFLYSRMPLWFAPLVICLGIVAVASLVGGTFFHDNRGTVLQLFIVWLGSLGSIGAVAFIGMNALSVQDDATFDFSNNRLLILRIALGGLFGIVLTLPFGFESFLTFLKSLSLSDQVATTASPAAGATSSNKGISLESTMLLLPFLLGFSTTLVIMILNQFVDAIQSFFGKKPSAPPSAPSAPAALPAPVVKPSGI
jgi:hypothetical protein